MCGFISMPYDLALENGGQVGDLGFSTSSPSALYHFIHLILTPQLQKFLNPALVVWFLSYIAWVALGVSLDQILGGYEESWYSWDDSLTVDPVDASLNFTEMDPHIEYLAINLTAFDEVRIMTIIFWML
jgi:hypothetical protein